MYDYDWEQRKLGEVSERVQGNDGRMDLPTLTISAANGWMSQEDRFSGNIAGKEQKNYTLLHKGELSYNHGNSKLATIVSNSRQKSRAVLFLYKTLPFARWWHIPNPLNKLIAWLRNSYESLYFAVGIFFRNEKREEHISP